MWKSSLLWLCLAACATTEVKKQVPPPELPDQDLRVLGQNLTDFDVALESKLVASEPITLSKVDWELVVDGKVVNKGSSPITGQAGPDAPGKFFFEQKSKYVDSADELKAMDGRGGSLLIALRGKATYQGPSGPGTIDFAHSREVRVPRLPHARFQEVEAGRYAEDEAGITFRIGVNNPNPFEVLVTAITYKVEVAGKKIAEGTIGKGERVSPASTGVFDLETKVNADTHGAAEIKKLIKSRNLPYVITGQLQADLFAEPFEFTGTINLPPAK